MTSQESICAMARRLISVARAGMKHGDLVPVTTGLRRYKAVLESAPIGEHETLERVIKIFGRLLSRRPKTDAGKIALMPTGYIPPTPETAAKARKTPDPVIQMQLTRAQKEAANETRAIYEQRFRSLQARGSNLNMDRVDVSLVIRDPGEDMREDLQKHYVRFFIPWQERLRKQRAVKGKSVCARDVVFVVLFDLAPCWMIDKALSATNGTASRIVKRALNDYWRGRE